MPEEKFKLSDHYGSFSQSGDSFAVRFERILNHPVKEVWDAITRPEQLAIWLGPTKIDAKKGGEVKVTVRQGVMGGKITNYMDILAITLDGRKIPHFPIEDWEKISRLAAAHYTIILHETLHPA
jgi:hypothetical protein